MEPRTRNLIALTVALLLLPLVGQVFYGGWYGARSLMYTWVLDLGLGIMDFGVLFTAMSTAEVIACALAGLIGLALGARWTLVVGAAVFSTGLFAMALSPVDGVPFALVWVAVGKGAVAVGLLAAAADVAPAPYNNLRIAALALLYASINAGALGGGVGAPAIMDRVGISGTVLALAVLCLVAVPLAVVFALAARLPVGTSTAPVRGPTRDALGLALVALGSLPVALFFHGISQAWELSYTTSPSPLWYSVEPTATLLVSVAIAVVMILLHAMGWRVPALVPAGLGLLLTGVMMVGCAAVVFLGIAPLPVIGVLTIGGVFAQVMVFPFLMSEALGDASWRITPCLAAAWLVTVRMVGTNVAIAPLGRMVDLVTVGGGALLAFAVGLAFLVAAVPLHRWLYATGSAE